MTDLVALAERLYRTVKWQQVPDETGWEDLVNLISDAIRRLYVISGRTVLFSEDKFIPGDSGVAERFEDDLLQDEKEWVLLHAQIEFYKAVQASVDDQRSYSTDAMSVTHGDKPYEHIGATIDRLEKELADVWTRMVRYNQLGVTG